jgi:hypothetical protein
MKEIFTSILTCKAARAGFNASTNIYTYGAGGFMEEKESLYLMRSTIRPPPPKHYYDPAPAPKEKDDGCSGDFVVLNFNEPYEWQRLPRPPFAPDGRTFWLRLRHHDHILHGGRRRSRNLCVSVVTVIIQRPWR